MEFPAENGKLPPGVRFHPTDIELVMHYLKRKVTGKPLEAGLVAEADIYQFHPADLREMACFNKDLNWYFFCATGKKYGSGERKNRSTRCGYWKPTGNDRVVLYRGRTVGKVKTLVFHEGKPAKGERTDWVMYEYRLEDGELANKSTSAAVVLCKIFKKGGLGPRNGEQYGAPYNEEEWDTEEEEDEILNNALVPAAIQDQSASAVMNDSVSANANPHHTPEQVYSGAVSVSGVYQAPTPTSDGANVASTSKGVIPDYNEAVDRMPDTNPEAASDMGSVPNHVDDLCCAADFAGIFDNLDDVIVLDDLDRPLFP